MPISFAEYKELPKKEVNKKYNLIPGKKYYMEDTSRKNDRYKVVYIGTYSEKRNDYNFFDDIELIVAPFGTEGKFSGFNAKKGFKYFEVIDFNPTELDYKNKNKTLTELHEFIHTKKAEPHDSTPPISFMGEDYRTAKHRFYNKTSSSRSRSRSTRSRSSTRGGRKHPKRRTVRRRNNK